jgi:hypothetical protein
MRFAAYLLKQKQKQKQKQSHQEGKKKKSQRMVHSLKHTNTQVKKKQPQ